MYLYVCVSLRSYDGEEKKNYCGVEKLNKKNEKAAYIVGYFQFSHHVSVSCVQGEYQAT